MNPDNELPNQPTVPTNPSPIPDPPTSPASGYGSVSQPSAPTVQAGPTLMPVVEPPAAVPSVMSPPPAPQPSINPPSQFVEPIPNPQMVYTPPPRSKKPLLLAIAAALVLIVGGVVAYFMIGGADGDSGDATDTANTDGEIGTASPIQYAYELAPICEGSRALPSNVTFSTDSKVRVIAFQEESYDPGHYAEAYGSLSEQNRMNYDDQTNIDAVACLDYTDQQLDSVTCELEDSDGNPLSAQMLRFTFDLRVIDLKTMNEIGSDTVTATNECPMLIMIDENNQFSADPDDGDMAAKIAEITAEM